jgi:rhodanese-related sulfurtransferase
MIQSAVKSLNVKEASLILSNETSAAFIDVRETDEVDAIATTSAKNYPMSQINPQTFSQDSGIAANQPLFVLCKAGGRSLRVAQALVAAGFSDVTNIEGGIIAWEREGLPVIKNN